ncbi:programmed cell death protein 2-like [Diadema antillarum]|uniref:programmed cell death protein 2-like n=1 Tax=Diadema antillarum TaxID=105358 RepID=UPI003A8B6EF6
MKLHYNKANLVELGFVEKTAKWRLTSQFFPSKVGGKPAWLNLTDVPGVNTLSCGQCGKVMTFLLEVYSPPDEQDTCANTELTEVEIESCFHRYVYIFCCRNPACHQERNTPFTVLRCQLPRRNPYFSYEPPDDEIEILPEDLISPEQFGVNLCAVCGCNAGTTKCGRCHTTAYCSKDHQIQDWKSGHKTTCGKGQGIISATSNKFLFPEYELVTEEENEEESDEEDEGRTDDKERDSALVSAEMQRVKRTENLISELKRNNFKEADLESMAKGETDDDRQFMAFKKRIASDPDQVLRYQKGGEPLHVSALQQAAEEDIPPCQCGARRQFEFQVLPQLLRHLDVDSLGDSIDWGTLLVYTCTKNCVEGPAYHPEFLWKQNFQNSSI